MLLLSQTNGPALAALMLATCGSALLLWRQRDVRGTTLLEPWCWTLLSLITIALSEAAAAGDMQIARQEALRYAARMTLFCPLMALLGAKRPQHRVWQFVVLSLWMILALPAAEPLLVGREMGFDVHPARQWLFVVLIIMGVINALPTRFCPSALFFASAQLLLLGEYLPGIGWQPGPGAGLVGIALFVMAIALATVMTPVRRAARPLDRIWLEFRDRFGVLWSLRVAERINAAAARYEWPVALTWRGFRARNGQPPESQLTPQQLRALEQNMNNLLRRFVSAEWMRQRGR